MAKGKRPEHDEQKSLFSWTLLAVTQWPELDLLFAIPNGGRRDAVTGARLKAEGVRAGVPDVCLPVARGGYHGLFIEMKVGKNKPTETQKAWLAALEEQGYRTEVCYGSEEAKRVIESYLESGDYD